MAGPEVTSRTAEIAALHVGNLSIGFQGLSINLASWSIAGSALVFLTVFLGRLAAQHWRTRRQDRGIVVLIQAQLQMFEPRYRDWPQTSAYLRNQWRENPTFQPFSSRTTSIDRPYDRHRDRLPLLMPLDLYRRLLLFYEEDRHFDDARAVVMTRDFLHLAVDRRLNWLDFLDDLAATQAELCSAILAETARLPGLSGGFAGWSGRIWSRLVGTPTVRHGAPAPAGDGRDAGPSDDGKNGAGHG